MTVRIRSGIGPGFYDQRNACRKDILEMGKSLWENAELRRRPSRLLERIVYVHFIGGSLELRLVLWG